MTFKTVSKIRTSLKKNWNIHLTSIRCLHNSLPPCLSLSFPRNIKHTVLPSLFFNVVVTHGIPSYPHSSTPSLQWHCIYRCFHSLSTIHFPISLETHSTRLSVPQLSEPACQGHHQLPSALLQSNHPQTCFALPGIFCWSSFSLKILYIGLPRTLHSPDFPPTFTGYTLIPLLISLHFPNFKIWLNLRFILWPIFFLYSFYVKLTQSLKFYEQS